MLMSHHRSTSTFKMRRRCAYTLIELVVSLVAASMLMVGLASAIVITTKAITPPGQQQAVFKAAETTFLIADEVQAAVHVVDQTTDALEFALADRDDDGLPEVIRYEWDDTNERILRTIGAQQESLLADVVQFYVEPQFRSAPEILGGVLTESAETSLNTSESATGSNSYSVDYFHGVANSVEVTHPVDTALWSVTEIDLRLRRTGSAQPGEVMVIRIQEAAGDGLPTSTILGEATVLLDNLPTTYAWTTLTFTGVERLLPDQNVCIVVLGDQYFGGYGGELQYASANFAGAGNLITSTYGSGWQHDPANCMYYRIRGTRFEFDQTTHQVDRHYVTGYDIKMLYGSGTSAVERSVRLLNTPEDLDAVWRLDFNTDPLVNIDVDVDGVEDWQASGSAPANAPQQSELTFQNGEGIQTAVANGFDGLVTVELRAKGLGMNATEVGAEFDVPFGMNGSNSGLITVKISRGSTAVQIARVTAADGGTGQTIALAPKLADNFVDVRLVIDPDTNQVGVWINDVFQGRSVVTQPLTTGTDKIAIRASGAAAVFDYFSARVGGDN